MQSSGSNPRRLRACMTNLSNFPAYGPPRNLCAVASAIAPGMKQSLGLKGPSSHSSFYSSFPDRCRASTSNSPLCNFASIVDFSDNGLRAGVGGLSRTRIALPRASRSILMEYIVSLLFHVIDTLGGDCLWSIACHFFSCQSELIIAVECIKPCGSIHSTQSMCRSELIHAVQSNAGG